MIALPGNRREIAFEVWLKELGKPYKWGGDNPLTGFDCSGLVLEGLKAAGVFPRVGDMTAEGLAQKYKRIANPDLRPGCLLFWIRGAKIGHVEIVYTILEGEVFTIGASGGGSTTVSPEAAVLADAYVKVRPAIKPWVAAVNPF